MHLPVLIVVNDPEDLPLKFEGANPVPAKSYLSDEKYAAMRGAKVFNLCRSYRYQSVGYYVSLLAAARGHKPVPSITTIQDLKSRTLMRTVSDDLGELIQKSLAPLQSAEFVLSVYFGRNLAKRYDRLSLHLFKSFPAPFLRAFFVRNKRTGWHLQHIGPIAVEDIPEDHREFASSAAREFFTRRSKMSRRKVPLRYDLAILHNPDEKEPPSNPRAMQRFMKAAEETGLAVELVKKEDYRRLAEFDALFIRETTAVTDHTYRFSRRAKAEGLVVIDDPESILKCCNKVFLAEVLGRHRVRTPRTVIVNRDNVGSVEGLLGFPCILKRPDSSFSQGVLKVDNREDLEDHVESMFEKSELVIAQNFLSTTYDWRVGIIDRQPLYVCKYYMAKKHWQIIRRDSRGLKTADGESETLAVEEAPPAVVRVALRAANLIGDGFYGVDVKQVDGRLYVIEVNDNPSIDSGVEDAVLKDELYATIMRVILRRIEQARKR